MIACLATTLLAVAGPVELVPLGLDVRGVVRPGMEPAALIEVGAGVVRTRRLLVDLGVGFVSRRAVETSDLTRGWHSWELSSTAFLPLSRRLAVGPAAGVAFRVYRQEWAVIDTGWMPFAGVRASGAVVRARTWALGATARIASDLGGTAFVTEAQHVLEVTPLEAQVGLRFELGRAPGGAP